MAETEKLEKTAAVQDAMMLGSMEESRLQTSDYAENSFDRAGTQILDSL